MEQHTSLKRKNAYLGEFTFAKCHYRSCRQEGHFMISIREHYLDNQSKVCVECIEPLINEMKKKKIGSCPDKKMDIGTDGSITYVPNAIESKGFNSKLGTTNFMKFCTASHSRIERDDAIVCFDKCCFLAQNTIDFFEEVEKNINFNNILDHIISEND